MAQYVDVLPTLIAAAAGDPRAVDTGLSGASGGGRGFDGISFLPVLLGESERLRDLRCTYQPGDHQGHRLSGTQRPG